MIKEKEALSLLRSYNLSTKDYEREKIELQSQGNNEPTVHQICWSLYNKLLKRTPEDDSNSLSRIYDMLAYLAVLNNENPFEYLKMSKLVELKNIASIGIYTRVRIMTFVDGKQCPASKKLKNKIFKTEDAIANPPVPCPDCTYDAYNNGIAYCTCGYEPLTEDE